MLYKTSLSYFQFMKNYRQGPERHLCPGTFQETGNRYEKTLTTFFHNEYQTQKKKEPEKKSKKTIQGSLWS